MERDEQSLFVKLLVPHFCDCGTQIGLGFPAMVGSSDAQLFDLRGGQHENGVKYRLPLRPRVVCRGFSTFMRPRNIVDVVTRTGDCSRFQMMHREAFTGPPLSQPSQMIVRASRVL